MSFRHSAFFGPNYKSFYRPPLEVAHASGAVITGSDGRRYIDAYNNVPVVGHSNPAVADAVHRALTRVNSHTRYVDETVDAYADRLGSTLPAGLERLIFTCSGSEANDLALQIAAHATGSRGVIVTSGAYHGTTTASAGISPSLIGADRLPDWVETVPVPKLSSPDFDAELAGAVTAAIGRLEARGHGFAAFVLDTTLTSDGILAAQPAGASADANPAATAALTQTATAGLTQTAAAVRDAGGLYIADEVQAGFGRTGTLWGIEQLGAAPDLMTMGKPMANGLPLAGVAGRADLVDAFGRAQRYFNTFAASPAVCAAGQAVLDELERLGMPAGAAALGALIDEHIASWADTLSFDLEVRRFGLMVGIDVSAGAPGRGARIKQHMYEHGVLVGTTGPGDDTVKFRPPLAITAAQLEEVCDVLAGACRAADRAH